VQNVTLAVGADVDEVFVVQWWSS